MLVPLPQEIMVIKEKVIMKHGKVSKEEVKKIQEIADSFSFSFPIAELLYFKGFDTCDKVKKHLYSNINHLRDTSLLTDADLFCDLLIEALKRGDAIVNYSDYDVDGAMSAVNFIKGVDAIQKFLGTSSQVHYYTNDRFLEGYGLTVAGVKDLLIKYPDTKMIVTTDNGISAVDGIDYAKKQGITVLVSDHHDVPYNEDALGNKTYLYPNADAVVDPKRADNQYGFDGLCGAGVIFKLLLLTAEKVGMTKEDLYFLLDYTGIATVADLVPLLDENRIIVIESLERVANEDKPVFRILRELLEEKAKEDGRKYEMHVNSDLYGYLYGPMINALGRVVGRVDNAIECFLAEDETKIRKLVTLLYENNEQRKEMTIEQTQLALDKLDESNLPSVIVAYDDSYTEGILGLIAGRLKEQYNRPAIALAKNIDGTLKGSARTIDEFPLYDELCKVKDVLLGFGGHKMAAGLSLEESKLEEFTDRINMLANNLLTEDDYTKKIVVDQLLSPNDITVEFLDELKRLEPFGVGYEKPSFGLKNFHSTESTVKNPLIGKTKETMKLIDKATGLPVLMFKNPERVGKLKDLHCPKPVGFPSLNVWKRTNFQGQEEISCTPQFIVNSHYIFN